MRHKCSEGQCGAVRKLNNVVRMLPWVSFQTHNKLARNACPPQVCLSEPDTPIISMSHTITLKHCSHGSQPIWATNSQPNHTKHFRSTIKYHILNAKVIHNLHVAKYYQGMPSAPPPKWTPDHLVETNKFNTCWISKTNMYSLSFCLPYNSLQEYAELCIHVPKSDMHSPSLSYSSFQTLGFFYAPVTTLQPLSNDMYEMIG